MILNYIPTCTLKGLIVGGAVGLVGGGIYGACVCSVNAIQAIAIRVIIQGSANIRGDWGTCLKMSSFNGMIGLSIIGACYGLFMDFI